MAVVLVSSDSGCQVFTDTGERETELPGRQVSALAPEPDGACLAVVDGQEIWRRARAGVWSRVTTVDSSLQSIVSVEGTIFAGGRDEAVMIRIPPGGPPERLQGFDHTAGRNEWFAGGPPLGVRSLTASADHSTVLAAVHVGGVPRTTDKGKTWTPTVPVMYDVHEVRAHPSLPKFIACAAAVGLCTSSDGGRTWTLYSEGFKNASSLSVAVLQDEVLFSFQDGPFATRSQVWRLRLADNRVEPVRDGLPEWLDGRVDTAQIAVGAGRAAIYDCGGNLWLSESGSRGWNRIATGLPYTFGVVIV